MARTPKTLPDAALDDVQGGIAIIAQSDTVDYDFKTPTAPLESQTDYFDGKLLTERDFSREQ